MKYKHFKIGERFHIESLTKHEVILAQVGIRMICFVCLIDGNRWHKPIEVENVNCITPVEIKKCLGSAKILKRL